MLRSIKYTKLILLIICSLIFHSHGVIYTYEDVELRRIFPNEFPQDIVRRSGSVDPEQLGRYNELQRYFKAPRDNINSHFEELVCHEHDNRKVCKLDFSRYTPEEDSYFSSKFSVKNTDPRRVYCFMMLCFTEDELTRAVTAF